MRSPFARAFALALVVPLFAASNARAADPGEVNIYSYRQPYLIDPLLKEFTDETGIKINVIFAENGLIERIQAEGRNSPDEDVTSGLSPYLHFGHVSTHHVFAALAARERWSRGDERDRQ